MWQIVITMAGKMLAAVLSQKFLMRLIIIGGDKLVASTKNTLVDDEIWKTYKESLKLQM